MSQKEAAKMFVKAVKAIAEKPQSLVNLEFYLGHHFEEWLQKYASTPGDMASEMKEFSNLIF